MNMIDVMLCSRDKEKEREREERVRGKEREMKLLLMKGNLQKGSYVQYE